MVTRRRHTPEQIIRNLSQPSPGLGDDEPAPAPLRFTVKVNPSVVQLRA